MSDLNRLLSKLLSSLQEFMEADYVYKGHELLLELGRGEYGVTKLFRNVETGELVAVKFIKGGHKLERTTKYVEREILILWMLSGHPSVVTYKDIFLTETHLGIAMEFAAGGALSNLVARAGRFPEDVARYFFQQLISGVAWCHSNTVCHRDLKLGNVLLDKYVPTGAVLTLDTLMASGPQLKICDFGFSKAADIHSQPKTSVGTPAYMAPEVLRDGPYDGKVADVWSCGVMLYVMLVGQHPFQDPEDPRNAQKTYERIRNVKYRVPHEIPISRDCLDLLRRIFRANPSRRVTLDEIQHHRWFRTNLPQELQGAGHYTSEWLRAPGVMGEAMAAIERIVADASAV